MRRDAVELERFYNSPKGQTADAMIWRRISVLWPDMRDLDVLGLGYAPPVLDRFDDAPRRSIAFMPDGQGAVIWPHTGKSRTALGDEVRLPFADSLFDRVVLLHALEEVESVPAFLREVWRVTAPQGRVALVVANRSGFWARADATPFGHGRPFSKGQLARVLNDSAFEPTAWSRALYAPPFDWCCGPERGGFWESLGETLFRGMSGLILVEATKRVAALTPRAARPAPIRIRGLEGAGASAITPSRNTTSTPDPSAKP
tara:strand:+ start:1067 stop:1843 length:777 start_codon:yes stop_codon:yes gene_type:complete